MRVQQEKTSQLSAPNMPGLQVPQLTWRNIPKARKNVLKCIENFQKPQNLTEHTEVIENVRDV